MRRPADGQVITQFEYPVCEDLGLLKMDFLGLRNLTVLSDAITNIERNGKTAPDLETLPFDDEKTYELLQRGDTLGEIGRASCRERVEDPDDAAGTDRTRRTKQARRSTEGRPQRRVIIRR